MPQQPAPAANDNRAAVRAFEQMLIAAVRGSLDHPQ
jgi:hypothetical protein